MDILQAIQTRHSVRDFLSKPLPKDIVMKIMEAATRSPSGGNGQPWEIFIASGATLEKIRQVYLQRAQHGPSVPPVPGGLGVPPAPPPQPEAIRERFAVVRNERLKLLGLDPADPASFKIFMDWAARLYGTPVLAVICMDKALTNNLDIGLLVQTICLAAMHFKVDTLIATNFVTHQDVLREALDIPENLNIITGVGLGYANPAAIINTYRAPRRPIEEVVRYKE